MPYAPAQPPPAAPQPAAPVVPPVYQAPAAPQAAPVQSVPAPQPRAEEPVAEPEEDDEIVDKKLPPFVQRLLGKKK